MGYVETILEPGERITHRAHLHWIVYWRGIVLMLIGAAFCFVGDLGDFGLVVASILIVLSAFVLLSAAIDRWSTEIVVTDQRVMMKRGLIGRNTIEINMPKVESVHVHQSILGRLLNYGTVIVHGTGGGFNPLAYVLAPLPLRRAVTLVAQASPSGL